MLAAARLQSAALAPRLRRGSIVAGRLPRKQHVLEAETGQVANAHRVQDAVEVIHLVLHDPGMETLDGAVDGCAMRIEALVAQLRGRGTRPRRPGTERQPSQPSSTSVPSAVSTGLIRTVRGTAGASG